MNIQEQYRKRANHYITEQPEQFPNDRIREIVQNATNSFWTTVAELIPEIETGDFSPLDTLEFERAAEKAIRTWINSNIGDSDPVM
jgi:hypothetical protein